MHRACLDDNDVAELLSDAAGPETRARLERHIDVCATCRALVAGVVNVSGFELQETALPEAAREATERGPSDSEGWTPPVRSGEQVDHFRVLGPLGRGGMADVYAAHDTKLDRRVALKMVRPSLLGSPEAIARFQREARMTARFSHPSIVAIHAVGEHAGRPYLALEYLEGETLRDRLRRGPQPLAEGLRIALAVVEALVEAHRYGILHRDLKPENIHIARDGRVRVLDFGLAKALSAAEDGEGAPGTSLSGPSGASASDPAVSSGPGTEVNFETRATTISGTPSYMAPEQWRGSAIGEATDVWAIGVILFLLSTGRRPFEADSHPELALSVCGEEPAPRLEGAGLPPTLADLVASCLEKDAAKRPTAAAVADALRGLVEPVRADVHREPERGSAHRGPARSAWRRTAVIATGLGVSLAIAVVLLARRAPPPPAEAPPEASMAAAVEPAPARTAAPPASASEPEPTAAAARNARPARATPAEAPPKPSSSAPSAPAPTRGELFGTRE